MAAHQTVEDMMGVLCALPDIVNISLTFHALQCDLDRVQYTYKLLKKHSLLTENAISFKCNNRATEVRNAGNDHYKNQRYWQALELFSESASHAETDSVELALAYGNRSSSLLRLGYSRHALEDVQRALGIKAIHSDYKEKLLKREEACQESLNTSKQFTTFGKLPELCGGPNPKLPSASKYVSIEYSADMGRQLVVNEDISPGQVILIEKPYSSILLPEHYYSHCSYCFTRCLNLIPCPHCDAAMFCDEQCYDTAMAQSHKIECSVLPYLNLLEVWKIDFLALKTLSKVSSQYKDLKKLRTIEEASTSDIYRSDDYINIHNLVGNTELRSVSDLFNRSVRATVLLHVLDTYSDYFQGFKEDKLDNMLLAGSLLLRYLQSFPCNAHEISEYSITDLCEIGAGAYAALSLINHSCDPHVVRYCYQDTVVLRTMLPIRKGEQIFDNYGHHYALNEFNERQAALWKQYYFKCACEACSNNWPLFIKIPEQECPQFKKKVNKEDFDKLLKKYEVSVANIFENRYSEKTINFLCDFLSYIDTHVKRPWKTFNTCQEALKHCWHGYSNNFTISKLKD